MLVLKSNFCLFNFFGLSSKAMNHAKLENKTNQIKVSVEVVFSPAHSTSNQLVYIYFVTMLNTGSQSAQLLRRHFFVRDASGLEQEVEGEGVIGQHPQLGAGETYRYNSFIPIQNPPGSMHGQYTFLSADGQEFSAEIPLFMLYEPPGYVPQNESNLESNHKRILN